MRKKVREITKHKTKGCVYLTKYERSVVRGRFLLNLVRSVTVL